MGFQKFVGKVVEGQDPEQRGRYYVHIPDLQPHLPESKGYLCTNSTGGSRMTNSDRGCYGGQHTPLHPGTVVQVECHTDDINSLRIKDIVSDDSPKTDMSPGKIMGVEPSGKVKQVAVSGLPDEVTELSENIVSQISSIINSGGQIAQQLLSSIKDKLGDFYSSMSKTFEEIKDQIPGGIPGELPKLRSISPSSFDISALKIDAFDTSMVEKQFAEIEKISEKNLKLPTEELTKLFGSSLPISESTKLTSVKDLLGNQPDPSKYQDVLKKLRDFRAQQLGKSNYAELDDILKTKVDIETGVMDKDKFVNQKKSDWGTKNANNIYNVSTTGASDNNDRPNYNYGEGTKKPNNNERDEQYTILMTPNKSGMYINEKTQNDGNSLYIIYRGKQTAIRLNEDGIHISTDHSFEQKISVNHDIEINGTSSITVNGGNYDIYVNGKTNLYSTGNINMYSDADINLRAAKNINLQTGQNITLQCPSDISMKSNGKTSFSSNGDFSIFSNAKFQVKSQGSAAIQSSGAISLKAGGQVSADGSKVQLNSGTSESSSAANFDIPSNPIAAPKKRSVCKI